MKKVKIGIIGMGGIAMGTHVPGLLKCEDAEITAVCDIDAAALTRAQEKLGLPAEKCYTDYRDLIADPDVEAVEVCTPNCVHAEMAIAALEAGKPVNLEKPVTMNYAQACAVLEAQKKTDTLGMVCFSYRFKPAVRYAMHLYAEGIIGDLVGVNVSYIKNSAFWEGRKLEWRFIKQAAGSGVAGDLGAHLVDLGQMLAGEITDICAVIDTVVKERPTLDGKEIRPVETDDSCLFLARFKNGALGTFHITRAAIGHVNTIRYDVYGTKGSISFDLNNPDVLMICAGEGDPRNLRFRTETVPEEYKLEQERAFVDALQGKQDKFFPTLEDGAQGQKVIDAILASAESGTWVKV